MKKEAFYYLSLGWSIIPILPKSKKPAIHWEEFQNRKATKDEIEKWFTDSDYGVGLVCGKISNVLVVDVDSYKKDKTLDIDSPVYVDTPRGGKHLYFKYDEKVKTTVNESLAIDIRSDGGYVLLPPSIHPNGIAYKWGNKDDIKNLPNAPSILSRVFTRVNNQTFDLQEYLNIEEGGRNDSLYKVACSLLSKHPSEIASQLIASINSNYKPPLSNSEVQTIFESAEKFVKQNPPGIPNKEIVAPEKRNLSERLASSSESFRVNLGYQGIDEVIKGFRSGSTYLVAGYEKSGKSSFLAKAAVNIMTNDIRVGYFNTELSDSDFITLLTALSLNINKDDVTEEERQGWTKNYEELISYYGISDLSDSETGLLDFEKTMLAAKGAVRDNCKVLIFDNLTTYATQATHSKKGWEILASASTRVGNFAKENDVICFIVIHTKPDCIFSETPTAIRGYIEDNQPEKVFEKSLTLVRRPSGADIYGGGASRSQVAGTILVWRPFQYFTKESLNQMTEILLESFRHAPSASSVKMTFYGGKGLFTQDNEVTSAQPDGQSQLSQDSQENDDYTKGEGIPF